LDKDEATAAAGKDGSRRLSILRGYEEKALVLNGRPFRFSNLACARRLRGPEGLGREGERDRETEIERDRERRERESAKDSER